MTTSPQLKHIFLFLGALTLSSSAGALADEPTFSPKCEKVETCPLVQHLNEYRKTHTHLMRHLSVGSPAYAACYAAQGDPKETHISKTKTLILCHDPISHEFIDSERLLADWVLHSKKEGPKK